MSGESNPSILAEYQASQLTYLPHTLSSAAGPLISIKKILCCSCFFTYETPAQSRIHLSSHTQVTGLEFSYKGGWKSEWPAFSVSVDSQCETLRWPADPLQKKRKKERKKEGREEYKPRTFFTFTVLRVAPGS